MYKIATVKFQFDYELEKKLNYISEKGYSIVSVLEKEIDMLNIKHYKLLLYHDKK